MKRDVRHSPLDWFSRLFIPVCLLLVLFWILWLFAYVVLRTYVGGDQAASNGGRLDLIWGLLLTAGLGWGALNVFWAMQSVRRRSERGFHLHWLIAVACGLTVIGIEAVMAARTLTLDPIVMNQASSEAPSTTAKPGNTSIAVSGDPELGKQVFSKACITCHGPAGGGMPNVAPSLIGSEFIKGAEDLAVSQVIRLGRGIDDPNNKSKKLMPARGGNPFLTDVDISHLVAFVRKIQSAPVAVGDATAIQLAAWVVPPPKRPSADLNQNQLSQERSAGMPLAETLSNRRIVLFRWLTLGLISTHALFFTGVLVLSSTLTIPRLLYGEPSVPIRRSRFAIGGWGIALVSWFLIFLLCFWWS